MTISHGSTPVIKIQIWRCKCTPNEILRWLLFQREEIFVKEENWTQRADLDRRSEKSGNSMSNFHRNEWIVYRTWWKRSRFKIVVKTKHKLYFKVHRQLKTVIVDELWSWKIKLAKIIDQPAYANVECRAKLTAIQDWSQIAHCPANLHPRAAVIAIQRTKRRIQAARVRVHYEPGWTLVRYAIAEISNDTARATGVVTWTSWRGAIQMDRRIPTVDDE